MSANLFYNCFELPVRQLGDDKLAEIQLPHFGVTKVDPCFESVDHSKQFHQFFRRIVSADQLLLDRGTQICNGDLRNCEKASAKPTTSYLGGRLN